MICPSCSFENPEGINFCGKCGVPLISPCPKCESGNPPGFKFCGKCGSPLSDQTSAPGADVGEEPDRGTPHDEPKPDIARPPQAERRQMTVMFCDLVGSTALSEQLDPEVLREVTLSYQQVCAEVVSRHEGHIAKYLGDGVLVYFGYPLAHEDDPQRAARAGLSIVEEMGKLNTTLQQNQGITLAVRIGIHTGLVVAGEMGAGETLESLAIVGQTPNVAARLEGVAEPDTVAISGATHRLIEGFFNCQELGVHTLRGVSEPMEAYRVLGESGAHSRLEAAAARGLTPLVGRDQEASVLLERWGHVKEGDGQVILLSGEAGMGKSRLVQLMKERLAAEPHFLAECRCSPHYQNTALYPVTDYLERLMRFSREDTPEEKLSKLEATVGQYFPRLPDITPLLAALLSVPLDDRYPSLDLSPNPPKDTDGRREDSGRGG